MAFTEQVTSAAIPVINTEVSFGTIVPDHDRVQVWADTLAIASQVKTKIAWRVYVTQSGITTMVKEFGPFDAALPPMLAGTIEAIPGATYELKGLVTYGAVSGVAIKGGLTGYDDQVDTALDASAATHTLAAVDQLFSTVAVYHSKYQARLDFNGASNPASRWRLYASVTGGGGVIKAQVEEYTITSPPPGGTIAIDKRDIGSQLWTLYGASIDPLAVGPLAPTVDAVLIGFDSTLIGVGGGVVLAGDVTGPSGANTAVRLTGAAGLIPISATGAVFDWVAATVAPGMKQDAATADVLPKNITVIPQAPVPGAATVANRHAGGFVVNQPPNVVGSNVNGGAFQVQYDGTSTFQVGQVAGLGALYTAVWIGTNASAPTGTNTTILTDNTGTVDLFGAGFIGLFNRNGAAFPGIGLSNTTAKLGSSVSAASFTGTQYYFDLVAAAVLHFTPGCTSADIKIDDNATVSGTGISMGIHGQSIAAGAAGVGGRLAIGGGAALGNYGNLLVDSPLDPGILEFTFSADANQQLTAAESANNMIVINDGVVLGVRTLTISRPVATAGMIFIKNLNAFSVVVQFLTGGSVTLATTTSALIGPKAGAAFKYMTAA